MASSLKDVAAACGVSTAVAAAALRNRGTLDELMRRGIQETAHAMDFVAPYTWSFYGRPTNTIGVLGVRHGQHPKKLGYFDEVLSGIFIAAGQYDQDVTVFRMNAASMGSQAFCDGRCDGLLVFQPGLSPEVVEAVIASGLPAVTIGEKAESNDFLYVDVNNYGAGRATAEYLIGLGHRRIAAIRGVNMGTWASERYRAYLDALVAAGIERDDRLTVDVSIVTADEGYDATCVLFDQARDAMPTAIICPDDYIAFGVMMRCHEIGVRVPVDVSVMGFDDVPDAAETKPTLTTIRQPKRTLGAKAVELLLTHIKNPTSPNRTVALPGELIARELTAPPQISS